MLRKVRTGARWLLDWHVRRTLRRHELPHKPEMRRLMRAASRKGFTFGAALSHQQTRALRQEAVTAACRVLPGERTK